MKIYSIYDSKAEAFMQPFFMQTKGLAIRAFEHTVNDSKTIFYKNPEDFILFELGEFIETSGQIINNNSVIAVIKAIELVKSDLDSQLNF